jgi:hypothetical protein
VVALLLAQAVVAAVGVEVMPEEVALQVKATAGEHSSAIAVMDMGVVVVALELLG